MQNQTLYCASRFKIGSWENEDLALCIECSEIIDKDMENANRLFLSNKDRNGNSSHVLNNNPLFLLNKVLPGDSSHLLNNDPLFRLNKDRSGNSSHILNNNPLFLSDTDLLWKKKVFSETIFETNSKPF
jgi:hypothetical protein